jgi:hypothetical protein
VLAVVLSFAFFAGGAWFGETWFPMLYAPAFLLFTVSAAVLGWGRTRFLPLFVFASGLLVHGHVSFFLYVGSTGLVVAAGWFVAHRGKCPGGAASAPACRVVVGRGVDPVPRPSGRADRQHLPQPVAGNTSSSAGRRRTTRGPCLRS